MCPPYVRFGFPSKPRSPCVGQALCPPRLVSAFCRLWPRLQALCLPCCPLCPPCIRSLSFLCSLVVRSLFALYPLFVGFWPAFVSSVFVLWFLRLCLFCPLLSALVEVFVAAPLPAVRLVTFCRQCSCRICALSFVFPLCPFFFV